MEEKICFYYNEGDLVSLQAFILLNEKMKESGQCELSRVDGSYFANDGTWFGSAGYPNNYTLVPAAEFIRRMKGEVEWEPKYGEIVEVSDFGDWLKGFYAGKNPHPKSKDNYPYCVIISEQGSGGAYKHIRPFQKSLRDDITEALQQLRKDQISEHVYAVQPYTDKIIDLIKQRKDEL